MKRREVEYNDRKIQFFNALFIRNALFFEAEGNRFGHAKRNSSYTQH